MEYNTSNHKAALKTMELSSHTYMASYKGATNIRVYCSFGSEIDAIRWINFNRDYMHPGTAKIETMAYPT